MERDQYIHPVHRDQGVQRIEKRCSEGCTLIADARTERERGLSVGVMQGSAAGLKVRVHGQEADAGGSEESDRRVPWHEDNNGCHGRPDDGAGVAGAGDWTHLPSVDEIQLAHIDAAVVVNGAVYQRGHQACRDALTKAWLPTSSSSQCTSPLPADVEKGKAGYSDLQEVPSAHKVTALEHRSASWTVMQSFCCGPSSEYWDRHPRRGVIFSTLVYTVPIGAAVLVLQATEATIASKGHLLLAAFSAIRDASTWLGSIFSFFWFFEMAAIGKLVGEGNWTRIGGHMVVSTAVSLLCGLLAMVALVLLAEPLLHFVSPPKDAEAIKDIALHAARVAAGSLPFSVYIFAGAGLLLGAQRIARTVGLFFLWGCGSAVGIVLALLRLDCRDEELEFCPEDIKTGIAGLDSVVEELSECRRSYAKDGWVCSSFQSFLASSAAVLAVSSAGLALSLMLCHWHLIAPFRVDLLAAARSSNLRREWRSEASWVAVRSVLGNSRHVMALAVALRMGITQSAAWLLFGSVSQLAYAIPSNLACVAMITISRLLGRGDVTNADKVLNDYRLFGMACGVVFCVVAAVGRDAIIESYSRETEEEGLRQVVQPVWGWLLAYQPARALAAVYQSLAAGRQAFSFWGKSTAACFFFVSLPSVIAAALRSDIHTLMMGEVLYTATLAALLYLKVHWLRGDEGCAKAEGEGEAGGDAWRGEGERASSGSRGRLEAEKAGEGCARAPGAAEAEAA